MRDEFIRIPLTVNAFEIEAAFRCRDIDEIFLPLLKRLTALWEANQERLVVFLAAAPGTGKSTLCAFLEDLSRRYAGVRPIRTVGLDGFHQSAAYLREHTVKIGGRDVPMTSVKGCPETYDLDGLKKKLRALRDAESVKWPVYSRALHDVVPDAVEATGDIIVVEGNWLLLDEPLWRELPKLCDYSVFVFAQEPMLRERLVDRKARGGLTREESEAFYETSDGVNVRRALDHRLPADLTLELLPDGAYRAVNHLRPGQGQ